MQRWRRRRGGTSSPGTTAGNYTVTATSPYLSGSFPYPSGIIAFIMLKRA
jgi:hypothetical protein